MTFRRCFFILSATLKAGELMCHPGSVRTKEESSGTLKTNRFVVWAFLGYSLLHQRRWMQHQWLVSLKSEEALGEISVWKPFPLISIFFLYGDSLFSAGLMPYSRPFIWKQVSLISVELALSKCGYDGILSGGKCLLTLRLHWMEPSPYFCTLPLDQPLCVLLQFANDSFLWQIMQGGNSVRDGECLGTGYVNLP